MWCRRAISEEAKTFLKLCFNTCCEAYNREGSSLSRLGGWILWITLFCCKNYTHQSELKIETNIFLGWIEASASLDSGRPRWAAQVVLANRWLWCCCLKRELLPGHNGEIMQHRAPGNPRLNALRSCFQTFSYVSELAAVLFVSKARQIVDKFRDCSLLNNSICFIFRTNRHPWPITVLNVSSIIHR